MKKLFILFVLGALVLPASLQAQKLNHFSQYFLIPHTLNAGFTGIEDYLDLKGGFRFNNNLQTGSPRNFFVAANFSIHPELPVNAPAKSLRISDASVYDRMAEEQAAGQKWGIRRHGLGLTFSRRSLDLYESTTGLLSYALHVPLSQTIKTSLGVSGGFQQDRLAENTLTVIDSDDPIYEALVADGGSQFITADINAGITVYHAKWYVGYAMNQLLTGSIANNVNANAEVSYLTHTIQGGFQFEANSDSEILLSGVVNHIPGVGTSYIANARWQYHDALWAGLAYRSEGAVSGYLGIISDARFSVSYAYDMVFGREIRDFTTGTHEVVLGIALFNTENTLPYFW